MPKRKVVQTVILYRNGERVKPPIGKIFDFTAEEVAQLAQVAPDALTRPIMEVDVENLEAQAKAKHDAEAALANPEAAKQKAEAEAAEAEAVAKAKAAKAGKSGKSNAADDEV